MDYVKVERVDRRTRRDRDKFPVRDWLLGEAGYAGLPLDGGWYLVPSTYASDPTKVMKQRYGRLPTEGRYEFEARQEVGGYTGRTFWYVYARYVSPDEVDQFHGFEPPVGAQ